MEIVLTLEECEAFIRAGVMIQFGLKEVAETSHWADYLEPTGYVVEGVKK